MGRRTIRVINQTPSGKIFKCFKCDKIHIEFKNLYFTFSDEEYESFKEYFLNFNGEYWHNIRKNSACRRKIVIPVGHKNLTTLFHLEEIRELKSLFLNSNLRNKEPDLISFADIGINISMN